MDLRQLTGPGQPASKEKPAEPERCLTLMAEGAAMNMPEIDAPSYRAFRSKVSSMAMQAPDRLPAADKLALVQAILREFEIYRNGAEEELRERLNGWRAMTSTILRTLLASLGIHAASSEAAMLVDRIASLLTSTEIQGYNLQLADFLRPQRKETSDFNAAPQKSVDRSIDNDNAAGLRGGGSAVQHLKRVMDCGVSGYVVLFRLGCLDMICERFGLDAVHDSLMAVAAFLTHSLRSDDAVYHWSDATLLAILQTPASEKVISAAMRRVVDNNRDTTIQIGGRNVMLRIPMEFDITPISQLDQPEDLYKFSIQDEAHW